MVMQLLHELHAAKLEAAEANNRLAEVLLQLHKTQLTQGQAQIQSQQNQAQLEPAALSRTSSLRSSRSPGRRATIAPSAGRLGSPIGTVPSDADFEADDDDEYVDDFEESRAGTPSLSRSNSIVVDSASDSDEPLQRFGGKMNKAKQPSAASLKGPRKAGSPSTKVSIAPALKQASKSATTSDVTSINTNINSSRPRSAEKRQSHAPAGASTYLPPSMTAQAQGQGQGVQSISDSNDPLGSALLNSQVLFRKQLASLKQRLQVANTGYYDAMLRNSTGGGMHSEDGALGDQGVGTYLQQQQEAVAGARRTLYNNYVPTAATRRAGTDTDTGTGAPVPSLDEMIAEYTRRRGQTQSQQVPTQMGMGMGSMPSLKPMQPGLQV